MMKRRMRILVMNMTMKSKMRVTLTRKNTCMADTKKLIHHEEEEEQGAEVEEEAEEDRDKI